MEFSVVTLPNRSEKSAFHPTTPQATLFVLIMFCTLKRIRFWYSNRHPHQCCTLMQLHRDFTRHSPITTPQRLLDNLCNDWTSSDWHIVYQNTLSIRDTNADTDNPHENLHSELISHTYNVPLIGHSSARSGFINLICRQVSASCPRPYRYRSTLPPFSNS